MLSAALNVQQPATRGRDLFDYIVALFTMVGVAIALCQSRRSGQIATEAKKAVQAAEKQLAATHLIADIPRLEKLETELRQAVSVDDHTLAADLLVRWRQEAWDLYGSHEVRPDARPEILEALRAVASEAEAAQAEIRESDQGSVRAQTKRSLSAIAEAVGQLSRHAGRLKNSTSGDLGE